MKKLIIFLMIFMLLFMSIPSSVFAAFLAVNIGPTTDMDGDVNIPSGSNYYKNSVLLAFGDITDALGVTMANVGSTAINASLIPDSADDTDLGSATFEWQSIYVGTAGKIYLGLTQEIALEVTDANTLAITASDNVDFSGGLDVAAGIEVGANIVSDAADTDNLGTADLEWKEIYISDAGHLYLGSGQDTNLQRTAAGILTLTAANGVVTSAGLTVTGDFLPAAASTHSLGSGAAEFADLYLDDTGYVYFGIAQDVNIQRNAANELTLTASSGVTISAGLTVTGTMGATTVTGEIRLITSDADPDTTGEIKHDSTATGFSGGVLRWFDDDSSRMIVDLETDATDDDYVVAYDADADGFYMKIDAFAGNYVEHFMDVHAEDADYCHAQMAGTEALQEITTAITSPDVPRNISVTYGTIGSSAGNVTITGTLVDGTTGQTETFAISGGDETIIGEKAFATVTQITIPATFYAATTIDVGLDNLIGLSNSISAEADVYKMTLDSLNGAVGTVNTTNNTVDCGAITGNSDYTFWYHG